MENNSLNESYLNYGDLKINQNDFLNAASSNLEDYLSQQSWSNKRKQMFRDAYSDIMSQGVTGATNTSGFWEITHNGNNIDLSSRSKKEQEMYGEAAYYIQLLMNKLVSSNKELEEKAKSEKSLFDNKYFTEHLNDYIGRKRFGGMDWTTNDYNELDTRGENGLRDTTNRRALLSRMLQGYVDSLKEEDLNFEGSPFTDLNDFRTRVNSVIESLNNNSPDLKEKLDSIGLRYSDWFNDGSNDPFQKDGYTGTYGEYYGTYLPKQEKLKQKELEKKQKAIDKENYDNTLILKFTNPKMLGASSTFLKTKYGNDSNKLRAQLLDYALNDITKLTPDLQSELHGAYKYLAKDSIDDKTLKRLQSSFRGTYKNSPPNRFKKINGIDNLIWDSLRRLVIQINTRKQLENILNLPTDLFNGVLTLLDKENEYFRNANDGFTDADKRELGAIALDLTAMFDPTRIYGTIAGVGASGLRTYNRWNDADGFTLSDLGASALDLGLNGVQWLPGVGNVANGAKGILSLAKFAPRIGRLIARGGAAGGLIYGIHGLPEVWNKIDFAHPVDSAKRLTVEDWRKLSALIAGIKGTRDLNVTNRATRRVLEQNDVQVSNRWTDKAGLTRTKIESEVATPTVRMKVGDKEVSIPIDENLRKNLGKKLNKKGNSSEERNKVAREDVELLKAAEKAGIKIKDKDGKLTKEWEEAVITYEPSWRDKTFFGRQLPGLAKNAGTFGTSTSSASNIGNPLKFLEYLNERGSLDKAWYGSNTTLRRINNNLLKNGIYGTGKTEQLSEAPKTTETSTVAESKHLTAKEIKELKENIKEFNKYSEGTAKHSGNNLSEEPFKAGDFNFEVDKFPNSSAGNIDVSFNGNVIKSISFKNLEDMMKQVAKFLKENRKLTDASGTFIKKINAKEMGEILKQLKVKGVFKQGGTIDKQKIQKYKEFIKK